jgi:hypothetical protein
MGQDLDKGNIFQAARRASLKPAQMDQINSLSEMYSQHNYLNSLPQDVAAYQFGQMPLDKQQKQAEFFGGIDDTDPQRGVLGQALYVISRPVVEPVKAVFKAANWASDQVTRAYRTGMIAGFEDMDLASAWRRSGANGEAVFNPGRIQKAVSQYGRDRVYVAQQISAGIPLDRIIREAQNESQKQIASTAAQGGDSLLDEAVAKVNAAKYSPGRQLANAFLPEDLEGKSGIYSWISGIGDATTRITLDPTLLLGKAAKGYYAGKFALEKTIGTVSKVEEGFKNPGIVRFWDEFTENTKMLKEARANNNGEAIALANTNLRRLNPAFVDNGVDTELIKFADSDFGGIINVDTAKAFLSNAKRIEPLFYGQPGFTVKIMPRLSAFRKKRLDFYTNTDRTFNLNKDSTDFLRNVVFDDADARGVDILTAARESITGRVGEDAIIAGARTAERIQSAKKLNRFSIAGINARLDKISSKFSLIPNMQYLGDFANEKSALAFEQYARFVYGRYASKILGDAYKTGNIGQRRQMFIGLQSAVGELRGLRGTPGGRKLLDTLGSLGRDAVYTNRVFDADDLTGAGYIPSQLPSGFDSAAYVYQLNDRLAFITPDQLDKFAARDGFFSRIWGTQYTDLADTAISTFVTGTLAGPRFPVRNAIEDYIFSLANGRGAIRSARDIYRARRTATQIRTVSKDLELGMVNRLAKAKDKDRFVSLFDDIDRGVKQVVNKDGTITKIPDTYTSAAEKELAKRQAFAEILLRDNFNDAQIGKFGNSFDQYSYEFAMYGDYESLLKSAAEGARNLNTGNDFISRTSKVARRKGRVVDFVFDEAEYTKQYGSFATLDALDQEGKLGWAFQIAAKVNDELGFTAMNAFAKYGDDQARIVKEISDYIDSPGFANLKARFDRHVSGGQGSLEHANVIYKDTKALFSRADGSFNEDFFGMFVKKSSTGKTSVSVEGFNSGWLPKAAKDLPRGIKGPRFIPSTQSNNIISDLNTRLWDWLGDANARLSRDQLVLDAAFDIRKDMQGYLDDLTAKVGKEEATRRVIQLSQDLAVERVLAFVDNPAVRTQMAWSLRNFARFYRATEDAYRRLGRTVKYNPEALQKIALTYEGVSHSGFVQRDDQGEPYFIYPGLAPVYTAVNKTLSVFGLGDKFVAPMPLQFGSDIRMLTPSANPESWLPTFSGPLAGISLKTIYSIAGFAEESTIPFLSRIGKEIGTTEKMTLGEIGEGQSFIQSALPGHVNRLLSLQSRDERDSQYASAFRKAVTYLEAGGHTPSATATPGELADYQKRLKSTITAVLGTRFILGFFSPASPTITLKSDMADWVRDNERVNFKQVFSKLIEQYQDTNDPVGNAMADWVKFFPDQVPYVINESDPVFQATFKTSNAAANWVDNNKDLIKQYPEGAAFLIPQSGTFTWESYQFLRDNGYRESKLVGDFLKETFVAKSKQWYYTQRDKYERDLEGAFTDYDRKRINEAWTLWSGDFKKSRPLLQEEFANSAANNIKRVAAYDDLRKMLQDQPISTPGANAIRQMISIYEDYKVQTETIYNSRSENDIKARDVLRESTLSQLKDIAARDSNAAGVFEVIFSSFLREG